MAQCSAKLSSITFLVFFVSILPFAAILNVSKETASLRDVISLQVMSRTPQTYMSISTPLSFNKRAHVSDFFLSLSGLSYLLLESKGLFPCSSRASFPMLLPLQSCIAPLLFSMAILAEGPQGM